MDARSQGLLLAAIITLSLAVDTALRSRRTRRQVLFMLFTANLSVWQLTSFFARTFGDPVWDRLSLLAAVLLPQGALRFFQAFRGSELQRSSRLARVSMALGIVAGALALSPWSETLVVRATILAQAAGLLYAATFQLHRTTRNLESKVEATRVDYLVFGGAATITFSILDFLPAVGVAFPPVGTFLSLIFVYVLSQSLQRHRLLDIYELVGRFAVLLLMGTTLAAIYTALMVWSELSGQFFLNAVVAALVILILFDPLRSTVETKIADVILRERWEFDRQVAATRADLWHVFDVNEIGEALISGLDQTRRATEAALYIVSKDGQRYECVKSLGQRAPQRLEYASLRPVLEWLEKDRVLDVRALGRELQGRKEDGPVSADGTTELLAEAATALEADVVLAISDEEPALGFLTLRDDRMGEEPYTADDIQILKPLASQVGVAVQNSQYYVKMKERDRLASLGEMAAGLAHEIRNPLGAIKGAAQLLEDTSIPVDREERSRESYPEMLDVIIEETNRLNRVVSSFLDYARPYQGHPEALDVNDLIQRTMHKAEAGRDHQVEFDLQLSDDLPLVRADAERLHQVFINIIRNAVQASEGEGSLKISTVRRTSRRQRRGSTRIEIRFSDSGPGIPEGVAEKVFIPFFTTKDDGTGLGLPICQRIVQDMGGIIEIDSHAGPGATFVVSLPAISDFDRDPCSVSFRAGSDHVNPL
jgi:signal transduction histidine kinase